MNRKQQKLIRALNRRLKESAKFWYQCSNEYQDVDDFVSSLNALIQSLRNLTFILQSNKGLIPDFEFWYAKYQSDLRKDKLMQWLNSARVTIVHKKDLELKSYAKVSILNWENLPIFEQEINPLIKNKNIKLPKPTNKEKIAFHKIFREPLIRVERKWVAESLPHIEILTALAHCYGKLKNLVIEAYRQAQVENPREIVKNFEKDNYLELCEAPESNRIIYFDFKSGKQMNPERKRLDIEHKTLEECEKRYGKVHKLQKSEVHDGSDPFNFVACFTRQARQVLKRDKAHVPILFYFSKNRPPILNVVPSKNKTEQYLIVRNIAKDVREMNLTGIIFISEAWYSKADIIKKGIFPPEDPNKKEALCVTVLRSDGRYYEETIPYVRKNGSICFGDHIVEKDKKNAFWLKPIFDAWKIDVTK